jgi:sec-independent protein translocase protein TatB
MLPDIGASELMVIALAALIFVGPKDLPVMLKKLGQFTSKMRRMAADFRTSFDDMARQSELEDLRREVEQMRANAAQTITDPIGVDDALRDTMYEVDASLTNDAAFDYDPGVPVVENELAAVAEPAPKKRAPRKPKAAIVEGGPKPRRPKVAAKTTGGSDETPAAPRRRSRIVS